MDGTFNKTWSKGMFFEHFDRRNGFNRKANPHGDKSLKIDR